ncbi:MAG: adenylate kinase [Candidatus Woesearchaeota archaeon]
MNVIIFGPPASGKGTQATIIKEQYHLHHIAAGDIIRDHIAKDTPFGQMALQYTQTGNLIPSHLVLEVIEKEILAHGKKGILLDGTPRSLDQAKKFDTWMKKNNMRIDVVIDLDVPDNVLLERSAQRHRSDDKPEVMQHRLEIYHQQTAPLIDYYKQQNILVHIDGVGTVQEVTKRIIDTLEGLSWISTK